MRIESLLARRLRVAEAPLLPAAENEPFACVAIIDISGYTQLTGKLAEYGGIDGIRDILNPPFELIIKTVHKRLGSVVKLAGDSAIVIWTVPPKLTTALGSELTSKAEIEKRSKEYICNLSILCCMELLELFEDYEVTINFNRSSHNIDVIRMESEISSSKLRLPLISGRSLSSEVVNREKFDSLLQEAPRKLQLHIGIGFDEVQHIFVGGETESANGRVAVRSEYFVTGMALFEAGNMLNHGKSGQLVFSQRLLQELEISPILQRLRESVSHDIVVLESQKSAFIELKATLGHLIPADLLGWEEGSLIFNSNPGKNLFSFIEPSLLKHLNLPCNNEGHHSTAGESSTNQPLVFSDNINQYRSITTMFVRLPKIPIKDIGHSVALLADVQFVAAEAIKTVAKYGGTCRQIHADEKALSALLVWGVEGFSHEKGNHLHAVAAGMELMNVLSLRKWSTSNRAGQQKISSGTFSIAITMGKAVEFEDMGDIYAKGIAGTVRLFAPKRMKNENHEEVDQQDIKLAGRETELAKLFECFEKWMMGDKSLALVVGKSGFGKTQLVKFFLRSIENETSIIICSAAARENRNESNYVYQQILAALYVQLSRKGWSPERITSERNVNKKMPKLAASSSSASLSSSITATRSSKAEFLSSLGIPRESIKTLCVNYPHIFDKCMEGTVEVEVAPKSTESVTALVAVIMTILEFLTIMQVKVVIFLDDSQWMDSGSFETTLQIIERYASAFVVLTSRPKEEYDEKLCAYWDHLDSFMFCEQIRIEKLSKSSVEKLIVTEMMRYGYNVETVSSTMLQDFYVKSQGNPMVIKLLCQFLSGNSDLSVVSKVLTIKDSSESDKDFNLPVDASSAVISTLDKMPSEVQMVLRIASIAGQFFSIAELEFCLERLKFNPLSREFILQSLSLAFRHGIISPFNIQLGVDGVDFSFHHYLIYQGIYESILQSRKKEIHQLYVEYYQNVYDASASQAHLPSLLHHLLKLPGHDEVKLKYFRIAFYIYADWNRPIEAKVYFNLLKEIESRHAAIPKSPIELSQEQRRLAVIETDLRNFKSAQQYFFRAFACLGCDIEKGNIVLLMKLLGWSSYVSKMIKTDDIKKKRTIALLALSRIFGRAFAKSKLKSFIKDFYSKASNGEGLNIAAHREVLDALTEVRFLVMSSTPFFVREPGLLVGLVQLLFYLGQTAGGETDENMLAVTSFSAGTVLMALGKLPQASRLFHEALTLFHDMEEVRLSLQTLSIPMTFGLLYWFQGEFEKCIPPFQHFASLTEKTLIGGAGAPMHFVRLQILVANTLLGNINHVVEEIHSYLVGFYKSDPQRALDIKMLLAFNLISLGRFTESFQIYDHMDLEVPLPFWQWLTGVKGDPKTTYFRAVIFAVLKAQVEVCRLSGIGFDLDDSASHEQIWKNLARSSEMLCSAVKNVKTLQPNLFPFFLVLIPVWLNFILLKHGARDGFKRRSAEKAFTKLCKSLSSTCSKGLKVFPPCYQFSLERVINTTKCLADVSPTDVFLTEHLRSRVFMKVARLCGLLSTDDKGAVLKILEGSRDRHIRNLEASGMGHEIKVSRQEDSSIPF
ncbi:hypothetical protein HDU97_003393 [Phlyctochytrium planicorne]|nr:hypothetical protein HDU97_003393 [Phlyctochytrium planicorne]